MRRLLLLLRRAIFVPVILARPFTALLLPEAVASRPASAVAPHSAGGVHILSRSQFLALAPTAALWLQSPKASWGATQQKPLAVPLTTVVRAQKTAQLLRQDMEGGTRLDEFRGEAKVILKGFDLRANIDDCAGRLQNRRSKEKAQELGRDAVEYIAQVVEFDAFDRLKKDYTSTVAQRELTPDKIVFVLNCLRAAESKLAEFLTYFKDEDVREAENLYERYYLPVSLQVAAR